MLTIVLLLNLLVTIIFVVMNIKNPQKAMLAILFLAVPVLGFLIYLFMLAVIVWRGKKKQYDRQSLVGRFNIKKEILHPEIKKELDVVSIEDAMAISKDTEKRSLLLSQLKNNMETNYKALLSASNDSDSESAHYVASAKVAVYDKRYNEFQIATTEYNKDIKNSKALGDVLEKIIALIDSELLAKSEQNIYRIQYCTLFEKLDALDKEKLDLKKYEQYIKSLIALEKYEQVNIIWSNYNKDFKTEEVFMKMLDMYYNTKEKQQFYKVIDEICESDIVLSFEGLNRLKFWLSEREKNVIH